MMSAPGLHKFSVRFSGRNDLVEMDLGDRHFSGDAGQACFRPTVYGQLSFGGHSSGWRGGANLGIEGMIPRMNDWMLKPDEKGNGSTSGRNICPLANKRGATAARDGDRGGEKGQGKKSSALGFSRFSHGKV
jgi:hypothetical protein